MGIVCLPVDRRRYVTTNGMGGLPLPPVLDLPRRPPLRPRTERDVLRGPAGAAMNPPPPTEYGCQLASLRKSCFPPTAGMSLSSCWTFLSNKTCLVDATEWGQR